MIRAIIVGSLISISASLLGTNLVLNRKSMFGDCLSHISFGAFSLSFILHKSPIIISLIIVIFSSFLILRVNENSSIKSDAVMAIVSSVSLSFGVVINSLFSSNGINIQNFMFGSILAISYEEVFISIFLFILISLFFIFFYKKIFLITFDYNFAISTGVNVNLYKNVISTLTAVTIVIGMRIVGSLLISSLFVIPCVISLLFSNSFKVFIFSSLFISLINFLISIFLSYFFSLPTGALIVLINFLVLVLVLIITKVFTK